MAEDEDSIVKSEVLCIHVVYLHTLNMLSLVFVIVLQMEHTTELPTPAGIV